MTRALPLIVILLTFSGCFDDQPGRSTTGNIFQDDWLIPKTRVVDPGVGRDGIPALEEPEFINANQVDFMGPDDLVIAVVGPEEIRAYPHKILDYHEIVNDRNGNLSYSLNYCPLTGTGMAWGMFLQGNFSTFGVSGFLYNGNLMPYDRRSESLWSQMLLKCVNGNLIGEEAVHYATVETRWSDWQEMYPDSKVLSLNTGYERSYDVYPYVDPLTSNDYRYTEFLIYPIDFADRRLFAKERVLGIVINDQAKVYRFGSFSGEPKLVRDNFNGEELLVVGSASKSFMAAFYEKTEGGDELELEFVDNDLPNIFKDNEGNTWDVFGRATDGPRVGEMLDRPINYMGYWFSFGAFFRDAEIFELE